MFEIHTVKPGRVPDGMGRLQAPHVDVAVFARGLIEHVITRIYFGDEDNDSDPVFSSVAGVRRHTLVASPSGGEYRFDVRLQGEHETVFFAI
jgi:protocatechuate 3,4-dioxygenase alpha subunit